MRKLFNALGCKIYGHHPWVQSTVKFDTEDGPLGVAIETRLADCKRCDHKGVGEWETHPLYTVHVTEFSMAWDGDHHTNKVAHEIRPVRDSNA